MKDRRLLRWLPLGVGLLVLAGSLYLLPTAVRVADEADRLPQGQRARPYRRAVRPVEDHALADAPTGLHGRAEGMDSVPYLWVFLGTGGVARFKGRETFLDEEGPARLREDLRPILDQPGRRRLDGHSEFHVLLAAGRLVASRHVRTVLDLLDEPEIGVDEVRWELRDPRFHSRSVQAARRVAWGRPDVAAPGIDVFLAADEREQSLAARLRLGTEEWWVPLAGGDRAGDVQAIEEEIWAEVATALGEAAQGAKHARILLRPADDRLAWGHLAGLIDALVGAGIESIEIPSWGLALELDVPPPVDVPEPRSDAAPVLTPWTLAGCVLAVLLAFAITFLPGRRERRRGKA